MNQYLITGVLYAHLIPICAMHGFKFHNAENDTATMLLWLPQNIGLCSIFQMHF